MLDLDAHTGNDLTQHLVGTTVFLAVRFFLGLAHQHASRRITLKATVLIQGRVVGGVRLASSMALFSCLAPASVEPKKKTHIEASVSGELSYWVTTLPRESPYVTFALAKVLLLVQEESMEEQEIGSEVT